MIIRTRDAYPKSLPPDVHHVQSANPSKMYRYGQEAYYQESSHDLRGLLGGALSDYGRFTFVLLKPDAMVARAGQRILDALERRDFKVRGSIRFCFNRFMWRELWRYELNVARAERYPLIDELLCSGPSLFVLLEDTSGAADGSVRLTHQKGNSDPQLRDPRSLRKEIGARAGTLNFVHCPDEFIDVVREAGVLFDAQGRARLASLMDGQNAGQGAGQGAARTEDAINAIAAIEADYPAHPLDLDSLKARLGPRFAAALRDNEETLRHAPYTLRDAFCARFGLSRWDWITIAASFLIFSHASTPRVFEFEVAS